jgi:GDPmannose 4,6-dehydratase
VDTGFARPKRALLTSVSGQDSFFLAKLLKSRGYYLVGIRHLPKVNNAESFFDKVIVGSFTDTAKMISTIRELQITEVYNLAAKSSVLNSWKNPEEYFEVNAYAVERLLSELTIFDSEIRFVQFGSTDMVGYSDVPAQPKVFKPWSPYGESKVQAHQAVRNIKEKQGLWAVNAILTNHDSYLRPTKFLMQMLAIQIADIVRGKENQIFVENTNIVRDWASAEEIVEGILRIVQQDQPLDWALASGTSFSITQLLDNVANIFNIDFEIVSIKSIEERRNEVERIYVDAMPGQIALDWKPILTAPLVLESMVRWHLDGKII